MIVTLRMIILISFSFIVSFAEFSLSEKQAEAILDISLRRLTRLEVPDHDFHWMISVFFIGIIKLYFMDSII